MQPIFVSFPAAIDGIVVTVDVNPAHVVAVVPDKANIHTGKGVRRNFNAAKLALVNGGLLLVVGDNTPANDTDADTLHQETVARLSGWVG